MPRTPWSSSCRSWYKGGGNGQGDDKDGPVTALHPGSRIHFFHMLENFRGEDFEYVYDADESQAGTGASRRNRFWYLGNGFSTKELDDDADPTWYLDDIALTSTTTSDTGASPKTRTRIKALL